MQKKALGKGLGALIPERVEESRDGILHVAIDKVKPNPLQPRENFDKKKLDELISSINEKGVLQPVLVRRKGDGYELIAGERRLRAAKTIGMDNIPVIVRDVNDVDALELSLIENIQREELNSIEEARAYQRLMNEFNFTQDEVAKAVGKDRASVSNTIRLLNLPSRAQGLIIEGSLSAGHAKALLSLTGEHTIMKLANRIVKSGLSVRETENIVSRRRAYSAKGDLPKLKDHKVMFFEEELQRALGTKVNIKHGKKRGQIQIEYYSMDDLERIYNIVKGLDLTKEV
ncbi:MAG: ParB/RepB/Spo0J family partition protein [Candidatus Omnitrophica bacterium]|nr:ParB/RepB/Spo0J family partition protein [Candidatus Omnitrophota bacterium]